MSNRITKQNKNYDDYQNSILNISKQYYPELFDNFNDASIGKWFVDIFSDIADNLNYHIDRVYQETNINTANETNSLLAIARTNNVRIPGRKAAIVEVEISCEIPTKIQNGNNVGDLSQYDTAYAPLIKRGTLFSTGTQTFELMENVNFNEQFDINGISNRQIYPNRDTNGNIYSYTVKKLSYALSGQSKIYKKVINPENVKPFMNVLLQDNNILGIDSIIVKDGTNLNTDPTIEEFFVDEELYTINNNEIRRFFEADNLIQQYRFGTKTSDEERSIIINNGDYYNSNYIASRGEWKRFKNKFITEFTDNWSLNIIFGAGIENTYGEIPRGDDEAEDKSLFTQYIMSHMSANDYMGVLPKQNSTMYILYRVGGGAKSNIAKNSLTNITYIDCVIDGNCEDANDSVKKKGVQTSIKVTNPSPSYGGKDIPSNEEIKYYIKYNNGAQNRCVTIKDYNTRIMNLPPKYGTPFRCDTVEENNKIVIYTLGLNSEGKLRTELSENVANNIKEYLKMYKTITDFIELRSGKIINLQFEVDVFIDKTYDKYEVIKQIIDIIKNYMDIQNHMMGEDIFVGDIEKEISMLNGVLNLIELRCYNKTGEGYGSEVIQETIDPNDQCYYNTEDGYTTLEALQIQGLSQIDLRASEKILYSECGTMFEIKNPDTEIKVNVKYK